MKTHTTFVTLIARLFKTTLHFAQRRKANRLLRHAALPMAILLATATAGTCDPPLALAVFNDDVRQVKQLLAQGEDINEASKSGWTPLMIAASRGEKNMVDVLLAEGADVNLKGFGGFSPLYLASVHAGPDIVKDLIKGGANVSIRENNGFTPVVGAALWGRPENIQALESAGAVFTNDLVYASALGQLDTVKDRLKDGADVNARNESGRTPLAAAAANGQLAVVNYLLEHGADVNTEGKDGNQAMSAVIFAAQNGHVEVVKALLDKKASLKADSAGETALFTAVDHGHVDVVKCLLDGGADPNGKNPSGEPLLLTAAQKSAEAVKVLIDAGADVNATNQLGSTALIIAAYYGNADSVLALLSKGARVSAKTPYGQTALQLASQMQDRDQIVEILSDPDAATKSMADFKAAKQGAPLDSKTMTKAEWKQAYYSRFPAGSIVTVVKFKGVFGEASHTQTVEADAYWYYDCSDGTIQVVLNDPNLVGDAACVQSVNDF